MRAGTRSAAAVLAGAAALLGACSADGSGDREPGPSVSSNSLPAGNSGFAALIEGTVREGPEGCYWLINSRQEEMPLIVKPGVTTLPGGDVLADGKTIRTGGGYATIDPTHHRDYIKRCGYKAGEQMAGPNDTPPTWAT